MVRVSPVAVALGVLVSSFSLLATAHDAPSAQIGCAAPSVLADIGPVCERTDGLLDVLDEDGHVLATVHGIDPPPDREDPVPGDVAGHTGGAGDAPPRMPFCVPVGTPFSMRIIYARSSDAADRYLTLRPSIQEMVKLAAGYVALSSDPFGVGVNLRVQCDATGIAVANVPLGRTTAQRTFSTIVSDLQARGFNDGRQKYEVWYDDGASAPCGGGLGSLFGDDRPGSENFNNGNAGPLFAVTWTCPTVLLGGEIMLHENTHNMGGVQNSAPNGSGGFHCIDGKDIMCYADGGPRSGQFSEAFCSLYLYDCNHNDYFHPNPPGGNYLATHWNVGGVNNRFIQRNACSLIESQPLIVGLPPGSSGVGFFGVNIDVVPVRSTCIGHSFTLTSQGGVALEDFDVCFERADGSHIQCFENTGGDTGTIPAGTVQASVWYFTGAQGTWILYAD